MSNCKICEKHKKENSNYIFETEYFKVYHGPLNSQILGYLFIEPKRHVESWAGLEKNEVLELIEVIKEVELMLKELLGAKKVYTVTIGEIVKHLHIHVIPRTEIEINSGIDLINQAIKQSFDGKKILSEEKITHLINEVKKRIK